MKSCLERRFSITTVYKCGCWLLLVVPWSIVALLLVAAWREGEEQPPEFYGVAFDERVLFEHIDQKPLVILADGVTVPPGAPVPLLFRHNMDLTLGHVSELWTDQGVLYCHGHFSQLTKNNPNRQKIKSIVEAARNGYRYQLSIGVDYKDLKDYPDGYKGKYKTYKGPLTVVHKCRLLEISVCEIGANSATSFKITMEGEKTK